MCEGDVPATEIAKPDDKKVKLLSAQELTDHIEAVMMFDIELAAKYVVTPEVKEHIFAEAFRVAEQSAFKSNKEEFHRLIGANLQLIKFGEQDAARRLRMVQDMEHLPSFAPVPATYSVTAK